MIGDAGGPRSLLSAYSHLPRARNVPQDELVEFVQRRKLHGRGIGWIDAHLLTSALIDKLRLWSADGRLRSAAKSLHLQDLDLQVLSNVRSSISDPSARIAERLLAGAFIA